MKRPIFMLITAITGAALGLLMLAAPSQAAVTFGIGSSPVIKFMFGTLGGLLLGMAFLNFAVRSHPDSNTLKIILLTNVVIHLLGMVNDLMAVSNGILQLGKILPAIFVHLFVGFGGWYYAMKIKSVVI